MSGDPDEPLPLSKIFIFGLDTEKKKAFFQKSKNQNFKFEKFF